jgi:hypothetical protein
MLMESSNVRSSVDERGAKFSARATAVALKDVVLEDTEVTGKIEIVQASSPRAEDPDRDIVHLIHTGTRAPGCAA